MSIQNVPPVVPIAPVEVPVMPNAPMVNPAVVAGQKVSMIAGALGAIAAPVLALALVGTGLSMIITGKPPKILQ